MDLLFLLTASRLQTWYVRISHTGVFAAMESLELFLRTPEKRTDSLEASEMWEVRNSQEMGPEEFTSSR